MKDHLMLCLYVFCHSRRAYWAFILGMVFCIGILEIGSYKIGHLQFQGPLHGLEDSIGQVFFKHYRKAAFGALFGFWSVSWKWFRKDWKRLVG